MKVLHINLSDISGGGSIAGYRLHEGLLAQGVSSNLLVGAPKLRNNSVATVPRKYRTEKQLLTLSRRLGLNYTHLISSFNIPKHSFYQAADILNFHVLHGGYFNYLAISQLTKHKPAIYTLHDMWGFTGHCSYSYDCDRWKTGCGKCPYPSIYPDIQRDSTDWEWKLKNWVYSHSNLTIVAPSQWLTEQAQQSMLSRFAIHHIPYGIDTEAYQPLDSEKCRSVLGIPSGKQVLMVGAENYGDSRKGGDLLLKALQALPDSVKTNCLLLVLGHGGEFLSETVGISSLNLGYVSNDRLKAIAYSAADLFILPTREDNLPLVLQESMACGTPTISFRIGGVPDLVRPGITGYLAEPENVTDLCNGIIQLLADKNLREQMAKNCREIALTEYPISLQAKRYIELYQQVLS
jgi:glycosyltransferase involved in cell wall biosynthesis